MLMRGSPVKKLNKIYPETRQFKYIYIFNPCGSPMETNLTLDSDLGNPIILDFRFRGLNSNLGFWNFDFKDKNQVGGFALFEHFLNTKIQCLNLNNLCFSIWVEILQALSSFFQFAYRWILPTCRFKYSIVISNPRLNWRHSKSWSFSPQHFCWLGVASSQVLNFTILGLVPNSENKLGTEHIEY